MAGSSGAENMDLNADMDADEEDYKRTHHNQLERRRRENIKTSFGGLKELIPGLSQVDKTSRAIILRRAAEYIRTLKSKNQIQKEEINAMRVTNQQLDNEFIALEKIKSVYRYTKVKQISAPSKMENLMNPIKLSKPKPKPVKYTVDTLAEACATTIGQTDIDEPEHSDSEEIPVKVMEQTEEIQPELTQQTKDMKSSNESADFSMIKSESLQ